MKTKYDVPVCPCGCGNSNDIDKIRTQGFIDHMRKQMKWSRYCMKDGKIFLPCVKDIKKNNWHLIEEYSLEEFLEGAETEHEKWAQTSLYRMLTESNAFIESEENKISK